MRQPVWDCLKWVVRSFQCSSHRRYLFATLYQRSPQYNPSDVVTATTILNQGSLSKARCRFETRMKLGNTSIPVTTTGYRPPRRAMKRDRTQAHMVESSSNSDDGIAVFLCHNDPCLAAHLYFPSKHPRSAKSIQSLKSLDQLVRGPSP